MLFRIDDHAETKRLGQDMLDRGQLQAVAAVEHGGRLRMIFGHGRYLAAKAVGIKTLEVNIHPAMDDTQFILTRTSENLQRKELTGWRKWLLCDGLIKLNGWDQKTLAEKMHLDQSSVTRYVAVGRCIQEVKDALRDGKITISDCYAISKLPEADQPGLLALRLTGCASRDVLENQGRKLRNAAKNGNSAPVARAAKIKCPLPSGHIITVTGDEISLEEAMESLQQAIKAIKKAIDTGLDAKTAQCVWRDMAKAG